MSGNWKNSTAGSGTSNRDWWPKQLNLEILHLHSPLGNPMGYKFDYAEEINKLDLAAVKNDLYSIPGSVLIRAAGSPLRTV